MKKPFIKTETKDGETRILVNGKSYLEFHKECDNYDFISKRTKKVVPRFIAFWNGEENYDLVVRGK